MRRRVGALAAAAAAVVLSGVVGVVPAAADGPTITFDPPLVDLYTAAPTFAGHATHGGTSGAGMRSVEVSYRSALAKGPGSCRVPGPAVFDGSGTRIDFSDAPELECNGRYDLTVHATSASSALHPEASAEERRRFALAVPPAVVTGLSAIPSSGVVTLNWNANTEKDLYGYLVDRRPPDGPFEAVAFVEGDRYVDEPPGPGDYTYRVWAVRLGPEQDAANGDDLVLASAPSTTSSATVAPPPDNRGGGGDGGDGGGGGSGGGSGGGGSQEPTATTSKPPPRQDLSGFQRLKSQVEAEARRRTTTTIDDFGETLPFEGGDSDSDSGLDDPSLQAGPQERSTFEEVVDRRAALVPVAGGLVLFVGAAQLRYLTRRAARQAIDG